jgi:FkbM family methyltransferase
MPSDQLSESSPGFTLQTAELDNKTFYCVNPEEVPIVYSQVQQYFSYNLALEPGSVVWDVGANVGLFAFWVQQTYPGVQIYSFEPVPILFQALQQNLPNIDSTNIQCFPFGLGREAKIVSFAYHPHATAMSTGYPYTPEERLELQTAIGQNLPPDQLEAFKPVLDRFFEYQLIECQIKTASEIIESQQIPKIDLLKIDVEKAELDVLLGFTPEDLAKVQRLVIEVHDIDHRLQTIQELLTQNQFQNIEIEQEPGLAGSNIYNLHAWR